MIESKSGMSGAGGGEKGELFLFFKIYVFARERTPKQGSQRERERISRRFCAQHRDLTTLRSQPEPKPTVGHQGDLLRKENFLIKGHSFS